MFSLNVAASCRRTTSGFWPAISCACAAGGPPTSTPPKLIFHVITRRLPPPEVDGAGVGAGAGAGAVVLPESKRTADRLPMAPFDPFESKTIRIDCTPADRDTFAVKSW